MNIFTIQDLAERLRTTSVALYCRRSRDPLSLPPALEIPGDARLLFDADVVEEWLRDPAAFMPKPKRGPGRPRKVTFGKGV